MLAIVLPGTIFYLTLLIPNSDNVELQFTEALTFSSCCSVEVPVDVHTVSFQPSAPPHSRSVAMAIAPFAHIPHLVPFCMGQPLHLLLHLKHVKTTALQPLNLPFSDDMHRRYSLRNLLSPVPGALSYLFSTRRVHFCRTTLDSRRSTWWQLVCCAPGRLS
jgi:hypothetical protein